MSDDSEVADLPSHNTDAEDEAAVVTDRPRSLPSSGSRSPGQA